MMKIVLHIGAHRTASTSFQAYLRRNARELRARRVGFWGPRRMRPYRNMLPKASASGPFTSEASAGDHVARQLDLAERRGIELLFLSDAEICGSVQENIRCAALYPNVGPQVEALARMFSGRLSSVVLTPRSLDQYWCSAAAQAVLQGAPVPERDTLSQIARSSRSWRDVIADVAKAMPDATLNVLPFEAFRSQSPAYFAAATGLAAPRCREPSWLNPSPTLPELRRVLAERDAPATVLPFGMGRWNPFTNEEHAIMREAYADDMMWLSSGADGFATLTEGCRPDRAGSTLPQAAQKKGQMDEFGHKQVARPG
ncbi:MAG: hypothetical protein AAF665_10750 [Pseudomonadota bacterium]